MATFLKGQSAKVDSLIQNINNDQLYGTCHYGWFLEMNSNAGNKLIKMGNSVVNQLVPFLDNREKGIISHYILTMITSGYSFNSSFEHFEKDSILDCNFNGLKFYDRMGHMYTSDSILFENKKKWIDIVNKNVLFSRIDTFHLIINKDRKK